MDEIQKAYKTLDKVEKDCNEAIELAMKLKLGILKKSISEQHQREICDQIIEILKR